MTSSETIITVNDVDIITASTAGETKLTEPTTSSSSTSTHWKLKYKDSDKQECEVYLPPCVNGSQSDVLLHLWLFKTQTANLTFEEDKDKAERLTLFASALSGVAAVNWNSVTTKWKKDNKPWKNDSLDELAMEWFKKFFIDENDQDNLHAYVSDCHKPRTMSVGSFSINLSILNELIEYLPGNKQSLDATEYKKAFHRAMPKTWKSRFEEHKRVDTEDMASMLRTYRNYETLASKKEQENQKRQKQSSLEAKKRKALNDDTPRENGGRGGRGGRGGGRGGRGGRFGGRGNPNPQYTTVKDEDPCPHHGGALSNHLWGDCRMHPKNRNKAPSDGDTKPTTKKTKFSDQHVNEVIPDFDTKLDAAVEEADNSLGSPGSNTCRCPGHRDDPNLFSGVSSLNQIKLRELQQQDPCQAWKHYKSILAYAQANNIGSQLLGEGYEL